MRRAHPGALLARWTLLALVLVLPACYRGAMLKLWLDDPLADRRQVRHVRERLRSPYPDVREEAVKQLENQLPRRRVQEAERARCEADELDEKLLPWEHLDGPDMNVVYIRCDQLTTRSTLAWKPSERASVRTVRRLAVSDPSEDVRSTARALLWDFGLTVEGRAPTRYHAIYESWPPCGYNEAND